MTAGDIESFTYSFFFSKLNTLYLSCVKLIKLFCHKLNINIELWFDNKHHFLKSHYIRCSSPLLNSLCSHNCRHHRGSMGIRSTRLILTPSSAVWFSKFATRTCLYPQLSWRLSNQLAPLATQPSLRQPLRPLRQVS
jgi:hypothetical protein